VSDVGYFFNRIGELLWVHEEFEDKLRRLVINWNPPQVPLCSNRGAPYSLWALHGDFRSVHELKGKGCEPVSHDIIHADNPKELIGTFDLVVVGISRCYEQNLLFFRLASQLIRTGGVVCVAGPNPWGVRRLEKEFSRYWDGVESLSKFHGRFFWSNSPRADAGAVQVQWVNESSDRVLEPGGMITSPGNFSWKGFDKGSELLIRTLIEGGYLEHISGAGADLGGGYGLLTKSILNCGNFESLVLLESDRWALNNAERNIQDARVRYLWCDIGMLGGHWDVRREGVDQNLQWVIMNPPFHKISGEVSLELGLSFFRVAHSLLCKGGRLFWVANSHLPYLSEVKGRFKEVAVVGRDAHFLVGYAEK
jgi:16S rRNA (guanine1207-N2)-methyltransferase